MEKTLAFCDRERLIDKGDKIIVGVSGGVDSVCLLHLLYEIRKPWELSLYVLHVHHGIRGSEADRDASFVREMAKRLGLPFCLVKKDVKGLAGTGMTEEEAGRKVRYEAFEEYRRKVGADKIAVAHHEDDQAETVLFHLFRGSGPRGLCGMPPRRGAVIRPLLAASRRELEEFARENALPYVTDGTNLLTEYTRNKMRLKLIPFVQREINSQAVSHIACLAEKNRKWSRYIETVAASAAGRMIEEREGRMDLLLEEFLKEDGVIQDEVLRILFLKCIPGAKDIRQVHYEQVRALADGVPGNRISLPGDITVVREYRALCFCAGTGGGDGPVAPVVCDVPSQHILKREGGNIRISMRLEERADLPLKIPQKDYTKWLDYDMIKGDLILRGPQEGDYFILNEKGDKKKLSRYYIDEKIPGSQRKQQLVLADGKHILWAIPGRISAAVRITERTKRVLVVTKERE